MSQYGPDCICSDHMPLSFTERIKTSIYYYNMLKGGESVIVGLSGGPDSVCLTHLLCNLDLDITLHALYVDHGLRPDEITSEIDFCSLLCNTLNIPFSVKKIASLDLMSGNRQSVAREERYKKFHERADEVGADKIAIAHNKNDNAETLLMNFLRGSGPTGLSGIPPVRDAIIRPLIEASREEIEEYLEEQRVDYIIDSSNNNMKYIRNRVRNSLIPVLKHYNPSITDALSNTAAIMREENNYIEMEVSKKLMKLISRKGENRIELFLSPLQYMDKVILRRLLRRAVDSVDSLHGIGRGHIEDIMLLIKNGLSGARVYLPDEIRVIKGYSTLIITCEPPVKIGEYELDIPGELLLKETGSVIKTEIIEKCSKDDSKTSVCLDAEKLNKTLKIRGRKSGDHFYPLGFGRRKKLQDFFVDEKVPKDERDRVPILLSQGDIVWIAGFRADDRFKVTDSTDVCVRLEIIERL